MIEALGLTQEELREAVVNKIVKEFLTSGEDEQYALIGDHIREDIENAIQGRIKETIQAKVDEIAQQHLLPDVGRLIEETCFQRTNQYGEVIKGERNMTFKELLHQKAVEYMEEKVNRAGKSRDEDPYSWDGKQTRLAFHIYQYMYMSVDDAIKKILANANQHLVDGIKKTVEASLADIAKRIKVGVSS